jgi:hypothetical protein
MLGDAQWSVFTSAANQGSLAGLSNSEENTAAAHLWPYAMWLGEGLTTADAVRRARKTKNAAVLTLACWVAATLGDHQDCQLHLTVQRRLQSQALAAAAKQSPAPAAAAPAATARAKKATKSKALSKRALKAAAKERRAKQVASQEKRKQAGLLLGLAAADPPPPPPPAKTKPKKRGKRKAPPPSRHDVFQARKRQADVARSPLFISLRVRSAANAAASN